MPYSVNAFKDFKDFKDFIDVRSSGAYGAVVPELSYAGQASNGAVSSALDTVA